MMPPGTMYCADCPVYPLLKALSAPLHSHEFIEGPIAEIRCAACKKPLETRIQSIFRCEQCFSAYIREYRLLSEVDYYDMDNISIFRYDINANRTVELGLLPELPPPENIDEIREDILEPYYMT